jgi:lipoprotein-anchoring transpeptidase ErfK/SrfK
VGPPLTVIQARLASAITITPAEGAAGVALNAPVDVTTTSGRLSSVTVTDGTGAPLAGALSAAGVRWQSNAALASGTTYHVKATVQDSAGISAQSSATFSTLTPWAHVTAAVMAPNNWAPLASNPTVGVGMPIVIHFSRSITSAAAQAAVLAHFAVTETQPVPGGWHWFSSRELHYRPQAYWPAGEHVTLTGSLDGWQVADGVWGSGAVSAQFTVGDSHVAVANLASDVMTVSSNGKVIGSYAFSGGRSYYPTMNGIHIAMDKEPVVVMDSATVGIPKGSPGYYHETVYNDVHITDSGEYVHDAPWSVGSQGRSNVSHGCINLGPNDSRAFYNFSQVGDVIQVVGGPRAPVLGDHGVMDWDTDWSQWTPAAPVAATPPPTTVAAAVASTTTVAPTTTVPTTTVPATTVPATTVPATTVPAAGTVSPTTKPSAPTTTSKA